MLLGRRLEFLTWAATGSRTKPDHLSHLERLAPLAIRDHLPHPEAQLVPKHFFGTKWNRIKIFGVSCFNLLPLGPFCSDRIWPVLWPEAPACKNQRGRHRNPKAEGTERLLFPVHLPVLSHLQDLQGLFDKKNVHELISCLATDKNKYFVEWQQLVSTLKWKRTEIIVET